MPSGSGADTLRPALALDAILARYPPSRHYWLAYSGGLDSRVLLHLCAELRRQQPALAITAVHVHHGLQAAAEEWSRRCEATCAEEGVPFRLLRVDARPKPGQSPEEAARAARYRALGALMAEGDALLTAQHQDDQAETLLLQLLRGAGLPGLAAMPERAAFGPGFLLRPLLGCARRELREYAEAQALAWVEDPSNLDVGYDRNFLRHEVIPLLVQRWPAVNATLSRSAQHCAEAQATLCALAQDLCRAALDPANGTLRVDRMRGYSEADQRLVLREWLKARGFRMPSSRVLEQVVKGALGAHPERSPAVRWSEGEIRRYRDELHLLPVLPPFDPAAAMPWDGVSPLRLPDANGELTACAAEGSGIAEAAWTAGRIEVRYRQGGETCRLAGRAGSRDLKKLFQEAGIPPWVRERTPLVYIDGRLAAVGGRWVCQAFAGAQGGRNIALAWRAPWDGVKG